MSSITPEPPYTAVIFTSTRAADGRGDADRDEMAGYDETATRMEQLAAQQPGYLGIESVSNRTIGITVSYWQSPDAARAWKGNAEHLNAQRIGKERWYESYALRIATVERDYRFDRTTPTEP